MLFEDERTIAHLLPEPGELTGLSEPLSALQTAEPDAVSGCVQLDDTPTSDSR